MPQSARLSTGGRGGMGKWGAKAIWAMPKYLRVNSNGASLSYGLLSAINQLAEMVCILSSGQK